MGRTGCSPPGCRSARWHGPYPSVAPLVLPPVASAPTVPDRADPNRSARSCQTDRVPTSGRTRTVAGDEPVNPRKARIGAAVSVVILLLMTIGNHKGRIEDLWLVGLAALIVLMMIGDWVLRRNGLRD